MPYPTRARKTRRRCTPAINDKGSPPSAKGTVARCEPRRPAAASDGARARASDRATRLRAITAHAAARAHVKGAGGVAGAAQARAGACVEVALRATGAAETGARPGGDVAGTPAGAGPPAGGVTGRASAVAAARALKVATVLARVAARLAPTPRGPTAQHERTSYNRNPPSRHQDLPRCVPGNG